MKKKVLIVIFVVLIILITVIGAIFYISNNDDEDKISSSISKSKKESKTNSDIINNESEENINYSEIKEYSQEEAKKLIDIFNEKCEVVVYLDVSASDDIIKSVREELDKKKYISDIEFVSSDDALEEMKERFSDKEYLFDGYEGVFPASYKLKIKFEKFEDIMNDEYMKEIKEDLEEIDNVKEIKSYDETFKSIYENYGIEALEDAIENGPESLKEYVEE